MTRNKSIKIAITGGIGSGKSSVARILVSHGEAVFSCDEIYGRLLEENGAMSESIIKAFGNGILSGGRIDRKKLSQLVFGDGDKLKKLNEITHPEILKAVDGICAQEKPVFFEVPLLFESAWQDKFDGVIVVLRSEEDRIASVMFRSGLSLEEVKNRIKSQLNYDICSFTEYYVIHNDGNFDKLEQETLKIADKIRSNYF